MNSTKNKLNSEIIFISRWYLDGGFISIQKSPGRAENLGQSALQECQMALLGARSTFGFWSNLESLFEDFFSRESYLDTFFNLYSEN